MELLKTLSAWGPSGLHHVADNATFSCDHVRSLAVHNASARCQFVRTNADCLSLASNGRLLAYLPAIYCPPLGGSLNFPPLAAGLPPWASVCLCLVLLCFLFVALGVSADQFFCPNLATISRTLRYKKNHAIEFSQIVALSIVGTAWQSGVWDIFVVQDHRAKDFGALKVVKKVGRV